MKNSDFEDERKPVAVFLPYRTPQWVDLAVSVCESLMTQGIEGTIVDVSQWNYPSYLVSRRRMTKWLAHRATLVHVPRKRVQGDNLRKLDTRLSPYIRSAALSAASIVLIVCSD